MNRIEIEVDQRLIKQLVADHLKALTGQSIDPANVVIETKSTQNCRSEWEQAEFRARYVKHLDLPKLRGVTL